MRRFRTSTIVLIMSVIIGVVLGALDAVLDAYFFGDGNVVREIFSPSPFEIYIRSFLLIVVFACGLVHSRVIARLVKAHEEIETLRGIIPICAVCKMIRDDLEAWHNVADYVSAHSDAEFSHGLCPTCENRQLQELERREAGLELPNAYKVSGRR